jgi:hypothetical protein
MWIDPTKACQHPNVLRQVMGDTYPSIDWYMCDSKTNTLIPIEETLE